MNRAERRAHRDKWLARTTRMMSAWASWRSFTQEERELWARKFAKNRARCSCEYCQAGSLHADKRRAPLPDLDPGERGSHASGWPALGPEGPGERSEPDK